MSDIFQLHAVLAHILREPVKGKWTALTPQQEQILYGPQDHGRDPQYPGGRKWGLYSWSVIGSDKQIDGGLHHMLFGEGVPADIPKCSALDNRRVLILGPLPYQGNLPMNRDFSGMIPEVTIMTQYDSAAVTEMLQKIADVPQKQKDIAAWRNAVDTNVGSGDAAGHLKELGEDV
mgnify:FL=1